MTIHNSCGAEHGSFVCALDEGHECFHASFRTALLGPEPVAVWPLTTEAGAAAIEAAARELVTNWGGPRDTTLADIEALRMALRRAGD